MKFKCEKCNKETKGEKEKYIETKLLCEKCYNKKKYNWGKC